MKLNNTKYGESHWICDKITLYKNIVKLYLIWKKNLNKHK